MNKEESSIHDFDFDLICEYFSTLHRQGPGSREATRRALSFIELPAEEARVADIGCGTGGQTMELAKHLSGSITGIDLFPMFIDLFNQNARKEGVEERVRGIVGSMEDLPFEAGELDLIWSEGAIYNMGFKNGVQAWHKLLKPGGYLAVTEATWFTEKRPSGIENYWNQAYPEIDTIARKVDIMQKSGYMPVATFILPETCWTDHFYVPQVKAQALFLEKHAGNETASKLVEEQRQEAKMYEKYKAYYGYTFFIGKKI